MAHFLIPALFVCLLFSGPIWGLFVLSKSDPQFRRHDYVRLAGAYYLLTAALAVAIYFAIQYEVELVALPLVIAIVILGAASPALLMFAIELTQPKNNDLPTCEVCGYCLIGNESGTCPECGEQITSTDGYSPRANPTESRHSL